MPKTSETVIQISNEDKIIQRNRRKLNEYPDKKQKLKKPMLRLERAMQQKKKKADELNIRIKERETLIELENEKVERSNERMLSVKNQKEFAALQKEIDSAKKTVKRMEDQILELEEAKEPIETELKDVLQEYEKVKTEYQSLEEDIEEKEKELQKVLDKSLSARNELIEHLSPDLKKQYDKLIKRKIIPAAVEIDSGSCLGCAMTIRPQVFNEIIKNKSGVCPSCQRILIYKPPIVEEEPKTKTKAKAKKKKSS